MTWRAITVGIGMLALGACSTSSTTGRDQEPHAIDSRAQSATNAGGPIANDSDNDKGDGATTMKPPTMSSVTMTYVGQERMRPPSSELSFDVSLNNPKDTPRWFLLPRRIEADSGPLDSPVSGVEVAQLDGTGSAIVGDFIGSPGFKAIHLAAGANVTIRAYVVAAAESPPAGEHTFEVIACDSFTVAGEPATAWFETTALPTTKAGASVSEKSATAVSSRMTPDLGAVPVVVAGDVERATVAVTLPTGL